MQLQKKKKKKKLTASQNICGRAKKSKLDGMRTSFLCSVPPLPIRMAAAFILAKKSASEPLRRGDFGVGQVGVGLSHHKKHFGSLDYALVLW